MSSKIGLIFTAIAFMLGLSAPVRAALAGEPETGCFARHLRAATALNKVRKPRYSRLTHGASESISEELMFAERLGLIPAIGLDLRARKLQKHGIPILCDDFVSMDATPRFREKSEQAPDPASRFVRVAASDIRDAIESAYASGGFSLVASEADRLAQDLNSATYDCLMRHVLESIRRTAELAPGYIDDAKRQDLKSPAKLSWRSIEIQMLFLEFAARLDRMAAPIQAQGIPILCQDVPPIP